MLNVKIIILLTSLCFCTAFCQSNYPKELNILERYNSLQFHESEIIHQLDSILNSTKHNKVTIVHFGDSHIQAEWPTSKTRDVLEKYYGGAGYGMIFPYSAAKTYSSKRYKTSHEGSWVFGKSFQSKPKVVLGISGMGVATNEVSSSLSFRFSELDTISDVMKFFMPKDSSVFDFNLDFGDTLVKIVTKDYFDDNKSYIKVPIPGKLRDFKISFSSNNTMQTKFELYGISVEASKNNGILYHSVGVGAAPYRSILQQELLHEHLMDINPDIVVLDFGTNDYLYKDKIDPGLSSTITKIIWRMRMVNPNLVIVLTTSQDLYYKGRHIKSGVEFRDLINSLALTEGCLFWDWYSIAGGSKSLLKWKSKGYCQKDLIHLTVKGYHAKGELFAEAFKNTLDSLKLNGRIDSLIYGGMDSFYKYNKKNTNEYSNESSSTASFIHKVKSGETLGEIAQRYKTSVKAIMRLNNLKSSLIVVNQKLKIPGSERIKVSEKSNDKKVHIVRSGDSLYSISRKYGVSTESLKKVNNLKSNMIHPGQRILLP